MSETFYDRKPWECPRCHKINGPHVDQCDCEPVDVTVEPVVEPMVEPTIDPARTAPCTWPYQGWWGIYPPSDPPTAWIQADNPLSRITINTPDIFRWQGRTTSG